MTSRWNVRADTPTTIVMWMGSILAVLVTIVWIGKNLYPTHVEAIRLNDDLERLQYEVSDACNSYLFDRLYNPRTETGELRFNDTSICIVTKHNKQCKTAICSTGFDGVFSLENLTYISIVKSPNSRILAISAR